MNNHISTSSIKDCCTLSTECAVTCSPSPDKKSILKEQQKNSPQHIQSLRKKYPEIFDVSIVESDDDDVCPICLELFDTENPAMESSCNHQFHLQCAEEWLQRNNSCPVCLRPFHYKVEDDDPKDQSSTLHQKLTHKSTRSSRSVRKHNRRSQHHHHSTLVSRPNSTNHSNRGRSNSLVGFLFSKLTGVFCSPSTNVTTERNRSSSSVYVRNG